MVMLLLVVAAIVTFGVLTITDARRARRQFTASPVDEPTPRAGRVTARSPSRNREREQDERHDHDPEHEPPHDGDGAPAA